MELRDTSNGETESELENHGNGGTRSLPGALHCSDDVNSSCSTPYVSAPSSPAHGSGGYYFSAPASPMHFVLCSPSYSAAATASTEAAASASGHFEFECASAGATSAGSMISADELFLNGQIRPMKLFSHLQRAQTQPQAIAPLLDLNAEEEKEKPEAAETGGRGRDVRIRSRSLQRKTRSLSPMRNHRFHWEEEEEQLTAKDLKTDPDRKEAEAETPTSSLSSSSGRNSSKRWIFLKELLYRSKSEGRARATVKDKFWRSISFSLSSKERTKPPPKKTGSSSSFAANGTAGKRRGQGPGPPPSAHERHYTANRAQAEEMRKRTFLPYRQGLLGCLGLTSRSYGAMNGFAKTLNPVSFT